MSWSQWQSGVRGVVVSAAFAFLASLPGIACADLRSPAPIRLDLDLAGIAVPVPVPPPATEALEPPPLLSFHEAPDQFYSQESTSPGLQFSLSPDEEELFLGWQFAF